MSSLRDLKSGSLNELVESIKNHIRKAPQNADLRAQLFQLLAIQGEWSKAADQLKLSGEMNEQVHPFEWLTDGDGRLGPVCEFISNSRYGWVPFEQIAELILIKPDGLSDLVWAQAELRLVDGRTHLGLIPVRYPETAETYQADEALSLARKTEWENLAENIYAGHGQKVLISDNQEIALLDLRSLRFLPIPSEQLNIAS